MKPHLHANVSAKKYGGKPEDYQAIHDFIDSSKSTVADVRHRAILHSAFGIYLVERVFGTTLTNSDGQVFSVRDVAEDHVQDDLGFIPSVDHWVKNMRIEPWMGGSKKYHRPKKLNIKFNTD